MADSDDRVELTDLDVIARYSLAVRAATADRHELIATLRADLDWLQSGRNRRTSASGSARSAPEPAAEPRRSAPDRRAPAAKKATAKKATSSRSTSARTPATATKRTAKKAPARKTTAKKTARRR